MSCSRFPQCFKSCCAVSLHLSIASAAKRCQAGSEVAKSCIGDWVKVVFQALGTVFSRDGAPQYSKKMLKNRGL